MRKLVILPLTIVLLIFGAAACGGGEEATATPTTPATPTLPDAATATPTQEPGETPTGEPTVSPTESPGTTPTQPPEETPTNGQPNGAEQGRQVAQDAGCMACHSIDGTQLTGPTWQGLYGSQVSLEDGSTVEADEEYLRESIVDPNAKIHEGFPANIMPRDFESRLSDEEIDQIIAYIRSLQ